MPHITTCTTCHKAYEETSEEYANSPTRECPICWKIERQKKMLNDRLHGRPLRHVNPEAYFPAPNDPIE